MDKVRIVSSRCSHGENSAVEIGNLTVEEAKHAEGLINGQNWMSVENGRPIFRGKFAELPDPIQDENMLPFWRKVTPEEGHLQQEIFDPEMAEFPFAAHIVIQSLCGYGYTPENYRRESEKLASYGFVQMRSRRENDGRYWEIWFLPGTYAAKGDLEEVIKAAKHDAQMKRLDHKKDTKASLDAAIEFLRRHVSFGSLEVSVQKLAMVLDD